MRYCEGFRLVRGWAWLGLALMLQGSAGAAEMPKRPPEQGPDTTAYRALAAEQRSLVTAVEQAIREESMKLLDACATARTVCWASRGGGEGWHGPPAGGQIPKKDFLSVAARSLRESGGKMRWRRAAVSPFGHTADLVWYANDYSAVYSVRITMHEFKKGKWLATALHFKTRGLLTK